MRMLPPGTGSWLVFIAGCVAAAYLLWLDLHPVAPKNPARASRACSGCGTEWTAMYDGPMEPITSCPNCPMSEEEFEALKEAVRNRRTEGVK